MLVGICSRWKHIVGYHLTGNSFNSSTLREIIFQIINNTEELGFHVNFITSDMGSGNTGLWKLLGISTNRFSKIKNYIIHPFDSTRYLYIIPDPPHILKNLKQSLLSNGILIISDDIVLKYNLPSDKIELKIELNNFNELINIQENSELLLTPKFKIDDIKCNNFSKMKVNKAKNMFSHDVSSSFELLADNNNKPEFISTAWFVKIVCKWFSLMTSRYHKIALGKKDTNLYSENIDFLHEVINIFTALKIGSSGFKPVQRGIMISTQSVIDLTEYLITRRNFQYVLTSRFTQDCVENLFSQIRQKNVIPHSLQFTNDLKLIAIAMYMKDINNTNYDNDDRQYLAGFLEYLSKKEEGKKSEIDTYKIQEPIEIPPFNKNVIPKMSHLELNSLYNIAGYIIKSITKICTTCNKCIQSVRSSIPLRFTFTKFVQLKCYTTHSLCFVTIKTFKVFLKFEQMFRYYCNFFNNTQNINWTSFLSNNLQKSMLIIS